jgi:DNA-binding transcriptional regulator YdaS (Cro superfamily)
MKEVTMTAVDLTIKARSMKALDRAIEIAGGPVALAAAIGTTDANLRSMQHRETITPKYVPLIWRATGVQPHELRADLYVNDGDVDEDGIDPDSPLGELHDTLGRVAMAPTLKQRLAMMLKAKEQLQAITQA